MAACLEKRCYLEQVPLSLPAPCSLFLSLARSLPSLFVFPLPPSLPLSPSHPPTLSLSLFLSPIIPASHWLCFLLLSFLLPLCVLFPLLSSPLSPAFFASFPPLSSPLSPRFASFSPLSSPFGSCCTFSFPCYLRLTFHLLACSPSVCLSRPPPKKRCYLEPVSFFSDHVPSRRHKRW